MRRIIYFLGGGIRKGRFHLGRRNIYAKYARNSNDSGESGEGHRRLCNIYQIKLLSTPLPFLLLLLLTGYPRCCYVLFRMLLCKRQVFQPRAADMNTKCRPWTTRVLVFRIYMTTTTTTTFENWLAKRPPFCPLRGQSG